MRAFLTELFDHITEMNNTDDTEYEDDDCDAFQEEDTPEPEGDFGGDADDEEDYGGRRRFLQLPGSVAGRHRHAVRDQSQFVAREQHYATPNNPVNTSDVRASTSTNLQVATSRLNAQIMAGATSVAGPSRFRAPPTDTLRSLVDSIPINDNSTSEVASNMSTNDSNIAPSRNAGLATTDLQFGENGSGRATISSPHVLRRGQEQLPHHRPPFIELDHPRTPSPGIPSTSRLPSGSNPAQLTHFQQTSSEPGSALAWPYHEPASPSTSTVPSAKEPSETRQPSGSTAGTDTRGRSVKRSLRNTLNAAEQYASSFFRRSPTRSTLDGEGAGPSHPSGSRN